MHPLIQLKTNTSLFLVAFALACFTLSPSTQAVLPPPPPDGGYPGNNTAEGNGALLSLTTGHNNTAIGFATLESNNTGEANTANGFEALSRNTSGGNNTATGSQALFHNTTGHENTANGVQALVGNTTGSNNAANGVDALSTNTTGNFNTANGFKALFSNIGGSFNTANGAGALQSNTIGGNNNTADGFLALLNNTTGSSNIALGFHAGLNLTTGSNNIDIGSVGAGGESNTIRIGSVQTRTVIKGISGVAVAGAAVVVNAGGQLGVAASSERFKKEIKPMDKASEAVLSLKPVSFRYKKEIDPEGIPQFGLVAEQVEKVNPALVARDDQGKAYTVRYEAVNAMLLNEFLKEHRKVEEHEATITQVKSTVAKQEAKIAQQQKDFQSKFAEQEKQLKALTSGMEKVSAQLEVTRPAPRTVVNNQ
jgi:hypothetical protein